MLALHTVIFAICQRLPACPLCLHAYGHNIPTLRGSSFVSIHFTNSHVLVECSRGSGDCVHLKEAIGMSGEESGTKPSALISTSIRLD